MPTISIKLIVHCFIPLFVGCFVYSCFRANTLFSNPSLYSITNTIIPPKNIIYHFLAYHFADSSWAYSFCALLQILKLFSIRFCAAFSILFCSSIEIFGAKYFNQTFDWWDLFFIIISIFLSCYLVQINLNKQLP